MTFCLVSSFARSFKPLRSGAPILTSPKRVYRKVRNRRRDFLHKESRQLVNKSGTLVFEDLSIKNMTKRPKPKHDEEIGQYRALGAAAKGGLNKSILDAGWGEFVTLCSYKAEEAGGSVVKVPPKDTSQECSGCGRIVQKDLWERWHSCAHCGAELDCDHNAALVRRFGACMILFKEEKG